MIVSNLIQHIYKVKVFHYETMMSCLDTLNYGNQSNYPR